MTAESAQGLLLTKALQLVETTRRKLSDAQARQHAPVAVTGRAFRMPGGVCSPDDLWGLLARAGDATEDVPPDRWDGRELLSSAGILPGKSVTSRGGFIHGVREFDAAFFGISAREARDLDPQQRLLLEVTWEALEDAQIAPSELRGTRTGVFVGICSSDYHELASRGPAEQLSGYTGTGMTRAPAAGRISYYFGLKGPSFVVDTACSSSLVALHLAVQSLRRGEIDRAIVAGVTLILEPSTHIAFSQAGMLSIDGRCKTFSDAADGYGRAEGLAAVVLERADVIARSGAEPLAWVLGTAVNQDGPAGGLTIPSGPAQQEVIRAALEDAKLSPSDVGFVEVHGTGTPLGDLIELNALAGVFAGSRSAAPPLPLGALKAHFGHMEAAAGIGGVIKVIEQMRRRQLPPFPRFGHLNSRFPWEQSPLRLPERAMPWGEPNAPLYAGVSSFGFSGTNAHVILGTAVRPGAPETDRIAWYPHVLPISARTTSALVDLRKGYTALSRDEAVPLGDMCSAAQLGRQAMPERVAVVARDRNVLRQALVAGDGTYKRKTAAGKVPKNAWMFTGQGAQHPGMGQEFYEKIPVFRKALDEYAAQLNDLAGFDLREALFGETGSARLHQTGFAQPATVAFELAMAEVWKAWGLSPDFVIGHSIGEIAAACVAGVFSIGDALRLAAARGALMQALPAGGRMVAVDAPAASFEALTRAHPDELSIAAVNAPNQTVLSGDGTLLAELVGRLGREGVHCRWLQVSHAFHSPLMRPAVRSFEEVASTVAYSRPRIRIVSGMTGNAADAEVATSRYWCAQILAPVLFSSGVKALGEAGCRAFVEVGPAPVLTALGPRSLPGDDIRWLASCRPSHELDQLEVCIASLFVEGFDLRWSAMRHGPASVPSVPLPKYPFQRSSYWLSWAPPSSRTAPGTEHPLLSRPPDMASAETATFETDITTAALPYLGDHCVFGTPIFPATGYAELLLAALSRCRATSQALESLEIERPLSLAPHVAQRLRVCVGMPNDPYACEVLAQGGRGEWIRLCRAQAGALRLADANVAGSPRPSAGLAVDVDAIRHRNSRKGLEHGDRFWALRTAVVWSEANDFALGRVVLPSELRSDAHAYQVHPVLLDGCFQVAMALSERETDLFLPVGLEALRVYRAGAMEGDCLVTVRSVGAGDVRVLDLALRADDGSLILEAAGITVHRTTRESMLRAAVTPFRGLYVRHLERCVSPPAERRDRPLLVCGAPGSLRRTIVEQARRDGMDVTEIPSLDGGTERGALARSNSRRLLIWVGEGRSEGSAPAEMQAEVRNACALVQVVRNAANASLRVLVDSSADDSHLTALLHSIAKEFPDLDASYLRVDAAVDRAAVLEEVRGSARASEVALTAEGRHEPRWAALPLPIPFGRSSLHPDATYLVTGGTGSLGRACAARMVAIGARHLLLVGRSAPSTAAAEAFERLRHGGVEIVVENADVGRADDVNRLFDAVLAKMPPLRGVVHAAGVLADAPVDALEADAFERAFAAKVRGARLVDARTRSHDVQFFLTFSSIAAAFGSAGQGAYAAANAACDVVMRERRRAGFPALSIQWGPWADSAMASGRDPRWHARLERWGIRPFSNEAGLDWFEALLFAPDLPPTVLVADVDWGRASSEWLAPGQRTQVASLAGASPRGRGEDERLVARLSVPPGERPAAIRAMLADLVARTLGLSDASGLSWTASFASLGMDSLAAVELASTVARVLHVQLPRRLELDQATLDQLATSLLEQPIPWDSLASRDSREDAPPAAEPAALATGLQAGLLGREQSWRGHHLTLAGLRWGDKSNNPVFLLHGIRAHAGAWAILAGALVDRGIANLVAPDMRGHGRSGHGPPGHCLDPVDAVRDLDLVVRTEAAEPVVLCAHSFGCTLACLYASLRPERVRALVLIEPVIPLLQLPRPAPGSLRSIIDGYEAAHRRFQRTVLPKVDVAVDLVQREYPALGRAFCERLARRTLTPVDGGYAWTWDPALREFERFAVPFMQADTLAEWFGQLRMPTRSYVAGESPLPTREYAEQIQRLAPQAEVVHLHGTHQLHAENPEPIAEFVRTLTHASRTAPRQATAMAHA